MPLQNKAVRLISFAQSHDHSSPLFKELNLLKLTDIVKQSNLLFTHNAINNNTPPIFKDYFAFTETNHQHNTINSLSSIYSTPRGSLQIPQYRTNVGKSSIRYICAITWNYTLKDFSTKNNDDHQQCPYWMNQLKISTLKKRLKKHFLEDY